MMKRTIKTFMAFLLMAAMLTASVLIPNGKTAEAATVYITVKDFANSLAKEIGLKSVNGSTSYGYVNALLEKGIIKEGDFTSYKSNITRGDVLVLLNRADEYLNNTTLDDKLVQTVIEKRISDISKIKKNKREDVAKAYLKGFMKGYSNGTYCTDRQMRGTKKITKAGALSCIKMLKNTKLRAKISPDGQLIRTTKLPIYADKYPYILASFPNDYYDWQFIYEWYTWRENGKPIEQVNLVDYASPVEVKNAKDEFAYLIDTNLDKWVEASKEHLRKVFNVDYRTIGDEWIDEIINSEKAMKFNEPWNRRLLQEYVDGMKKNKTIVESKSIDIDGSTLYFSNSRYYLRVHVKYRVVSSNIPSNVSVDELIYGRPHNDILFSKYSSDLRGFKLGEWYDGYYEVVLSDYATGDLEFADAVFNNPLYKARKVTK